MKPDLPNKFIRQLKAQAQKLDAVLKVGKQGLSDEFLKSVDEVLKHHELIKVKFVEFKTERKQLAPMLAEKTASHLIQLVGHVAVLYRAKPSETK